MKTSMNKLEKTVSQILSIVLPVSQWYLTIFILLTFKAYSIMQLLVLGAMLFSIVMCYRKVQQALLLSISSDK